MMMKCDEHVNKFSIVTFLSVDTPKFVMAAFVKTKTKFSFEVETFGFTSFLHVLSFDEFWFGKLFYRGAIFFCIESCFLRIITTYIILFLYVL